jgi:Cu(I)/Ag(I) efflux system membrane fusion protein
MSESALKLAEVQTDRVRKGIASKEIRLYGTVQADERLLQSQTAHVPGRIEQLLINVTGETVKNGQLIAKIYSPELVTAQKELLEAKSLGGRYPAVLEAAREKLRNWKLSEQQIQGIENSGMVTSTFEIYANTSGIVINRRVNEGDHVSTGMVLFDVADLTNVWGVFDAYESDLPWIKLGQKIEFTTQALPGKTLTGTVSFIDPLIDPVLRIARVRIELKNSSLQLKPGMFINGLVRSGLKGSDQLITIPQSAVLWTGTRSIVYVKIPGTEYPSFKMREITLGASMKDSFIVLDGLQEGEEIVTNGVFSVDASAQLSGKPSMMNPVGGKVPVGHDHGGMEMNSNESSLREMDHSGQEMPVDKSLLVTVDPAFIQQLTQVYDQYIAYKNALVKSDPSKAQQIVKPLKEALDKTDMNLLKGDAHSIWMVHLNKITKSLEKLMASEDNLEQQRRALAPISEALYQSIKQFGINSDVVYYQYCPMAIGNQGAYWLSEEEDINNPYFGVAMLKCGETREILNK